jgi:hypothetical protein
MTEFATQLVWENQGSPQPRLATIVVERPIPITAKLFGVWEQDIEASFQHFPSDVRTYDGLFRFPREVILDQVNSAIARATQWSTCRYRAPRFVPALWSGPDGMPSRPNSSTRRRLSTMQHTGMIFMLLGCSATGRPTVFGPSSTWRRKSSPRRRPEDESRQEYLYRLSTLQSRTVPGI